MSNSSRKIAQFYPYQFSDGALGLEVLSVTLDDGDVRVPEEGARSIVVGDEWRSAKLLICCEASPSVLEHVLPNGEQRLPSAELILSCRCPSTHLLQVHVLALAGAPPTIHHEITLSADEIAKECHLCLDLVRTRDMLCTEAGRFARQSKMGLATATPWTLCFTPAADKNGRYMDTQFTSFSDDSRVPDELRESFYYLNVDIMDPLLLLNTDHRDLHTALLSRGTRGTKARVRDLALDLLKERVWPDLIVRALSDLDDSDDLEQTWQEGVLRQWLPRIYDTEDVEPTQHALAEFKTDGLRFRSHLESFFQAQAGLGRRFEQLLKERL